MAGLTPGPIGKSLAGQIVGLTQACSPFDEVLKAGFIASGARVYDRPLPDALDTAAAADWLARAGSAIGAPIDILIHNRRERTPCVAETITFATWRATQTYLVDAAFLLSTAFASQQIAAGRPGTVLTLVDALVMETPVGAGGTGVASAALAAMTRGWAVEWAADGIRANILGYGLWDDTLTALSTASSGDLASTTPLGRLGTAEDVVAMALYLCSPYAAYVTGATMVVDGGEGLRHTLGGPPFRPPRERLPT